MGTSQGRVTADDAAGALARGLAAAEKLIAEPDQGLKIVTSRMAPASAEPWNSEAGAVVMTAHQGLRDLETEVRHLAGLGDRPQPRGGSTANTYEALDQIVIIAGNLAGRDAARVTRALFSWASAAERLPAVDERARWLAIRAGGKAPPCPGCGNYTLRMSETSLMIACFYPDCPRPDGDDGGLRIVGQLAWSKVSADPVLIWHDHPAG